ncbi:MAG: TolC family protein [Planctomycetes bacterium]|nr:TolC family protein [Planctomycetota bacterium]
MVECLFSVFSVGSLLLAAGCGWNQEALDWYEPILIEHRPPQERSPQEARRDVADNMRRKAQWTVRDCIELAYLYNERLLARGETYYQAVLARDRTLALALPSLAFRATFYRQEFAPDFGRAAGFSLRARDEEYFRLKAPIFSGFREAHAVAAAEAIIEAEAAALRFEKASIAVSVAESFFGILKLGRAIETLDRSLATQRERRTEMEERVKAGVSRRTELLLVEAQLAANEARLTRARNDLVIARERLAVLIGGTLEKPLVDDVADEPPPPVDALLEAAHRERADLAVLERRRSAAEAEIRAQRSAWFPTVSFTGNVYAHRDGVSEDIDWDLLLESEFNLYAGGGDRARLAEAHSKFRQAEYAIRSLRLDIGLGVRQEYHGWQTLAEDVRSLEKEEALAAENHRLLLEEYKQRLATNLEVQLAHDALLTAQLDLERARLDKKAALYRIRFVAGTLK